MHTIFELPVPGQALDVYYPLPQMSFEPELAVQDWELSKVQRNSLRALTIFHDATADLLRRYLKLSPNSIRYLQKHLDALCPEEEQDRYVEINSAPKQNEESPFGRGRFVYRLGKRGHALMKSEGRITGRYRRKEESLKKSIPMRHRLAVNEFLYKAILITEQLPGVTLLFRMHEKEWNAKPLQVSVLTDAGYEVRRKLSFDLTLRYLVETPRHQYMLHPEINLSPVWQQDWRMRIRTILTSISEYGGPSVYHERFKTNLLTAIPILVASSDDFPRRDLTTLTDAEREERRLETLNRCDRMQNLIDYTEAELTHLGLREHADLFYFSYAPLDEITPYDLFFSPHWVIPFDRQTRRQLMFYRKY